MITKIYSRYFLFVLLSFSTFLLSGQPKIPSRTSPPQAINDFAGMLSASDRANLEQQARSYYTSTEIALVVVTIPDLGDYDIVDWAVEIGKKWGVGSAQKDKGVVILIAAAPKRKVFIATGLGVQGFLPDVICKRIIEQKMIPNFREGRMNQGIADAFQAIQNAAKGDVLIEKETLSQGKSSNSDALFWVFIVLLCVILFFVIFSRFMRNRYAQYGSTRREYRSGNDGGWIIWGGGGGFGGGSDWGGSSGGDSGFGGFGGGDFDGGGAGGDW